MKRYDCDSERGWGEETYLWWWVDGEQRGCSLAKVGRIASLGLAPNNGPKLIRRWESGQSREGLPNGISTVENSAKVTVFPVLPLCTCTETPRRVALPQKSFHVSMPCPHDDL